jgi:hypothetical protein
MSDAMRDAWNEVAEQFEALGKMAKGRYQVATSGVADAPETEAAQEAAQEAGNALKEAFDRFVEAGRELGDRATSVARDDEVKAEAKRAAASLNDALAKTVDLITDQVGGLFRKGQGAKPAEPRPEPEPPTDERP